jgi:hypothetical protein
LDFPQSAYGHFYLHGAYSYHYPDARHYKLYSIDIYSKIFFKQNESVIGQSQNYTLYVSSAKRLFWISIFIALTYLFFLLANSISLGWIRDCGITHMDDPVHRVLGSYAAIYSTILFAMALYYGHDFNTIICNHIYKTSLSGSLESEELNAAVRFRRIFIILVIATASCVFFSVLTTAFLLSLWPTIVLFVGGHALTYQTILIGVFYTQSQNTKAYVRRLTLSEKTNNNAWHTITNNAYLELEKVMQNTVLHVIALWCKMCQKPNRRLNFPEPAAKHPLIQITQSRVMKI